jgi:hypothetical protein
VHKKVPGSSPCLILVATTRYNHRQPAVLRVRIVTDRRLRGGVALHRKRLTRFPAFCVRQV